MNRYGIRIPPALIGVPALLLLAFVVACGGAAETPADTAQPAQQADSQAAAAPAATEPAAAAQPAATEAPPADAMANQELLTDKIILGLITPIDDTVVPWLGGVDFVYQHSPFIEYLVQLDPYTSEWSPMLARSWEMNAPETCGPLNWSRASSSIRGSASSPPRTWRTASS